MPLLLVLLMMTTTTISGVSVLDNILLYSVGSVVLWSDGIFQISTNKWLSVALFCSYRTADAAYDLLLLLVFIIIRFLCENYNIYFILIFSIIYFIH